ncbi:MuDR family transposase [Fagus crenata]
MDHRACVRHIYANFRDSGHRGKALKDKLWAAASAYTEFEFDAHMAELKKLSPPAYEYFSKIPVATWSRSRFTKNPKSDLIVNNLSECFNSYILDVRDKPILTMIDTIRRKLMRRFQVNRASIAKMSGNLCPKIQVKVEKAGVKASECLLLYSGEGKYEGKKKKSTGGATGSAGGATSSAGATGTPSKGKKKAAGGATGTAGSSGTTAKGKKKSRGAGAAGTAAAVTAAGGVGGAVTAAGGAGGAVTVAGGAGGAVTAAGGAVTAVRGAETAALEVEKPK